MKKLSKRSLIPLEKEAMHWFEKLLISHGPLFKEIQKIPDEQQEELKRKLSPLIAQCAGATAHLFRNPKWQEECKKGKKCQGGDNDNIHSKKAWPQNLPLAVFLQNRNFCYKCDLPGEWLKKFS